MNNTKPDVKKLMLGFSNRLSARDGMSLYERRNVSGRETVIKLQYQFFIAG